MITRFESTAMIFLGIIAVTVAKDNIVALTVILINLLAWLASALLNKE